MNTKNKGFILLFPVILLSSFIVLSLLSASQAVAVCEETFRHKISDVQVWLNKQSSVDETSFYSS